MSTRLSEHSLPAVHAGHLVELTRRWGVTPPQLLGPLNIDPAQLSEPHARMGFDTLQALVERARVLTGERGLGIYLGLAMRISWHGHLGFAAMTAGTVRQALDLVSRFLPTRTTALGMRVHEEPKSKLAALVLEENVPFGVMQDALVFFLLIGVAHLASALTEHEPTGVLDVAFEEPAYFARFKDAVKIPVRFGQPQHQLVFDAAVLDLPLRMADAAALRLATEQCERELAALGFIGKVASRVQAALERPAGGFHALDEVAKALHLSERTLKRKLAAEGTSYTALLEEERRQRAMLLLRSDSLSMDEVAERLGYADAAAFTHAFTRWTGKPPRAFRRAQSE
ncbi:MAG: AraC family transcriptional regulator [Myxococcaceae bacterium]